MTRMFGNRAIEASEAEHIRNDVTYVVNIGSESLHPDRTIHWRFIEAGLSDCEFGCKIYVDPLSSVRVLVHNPIYGCSKQPDI